MIDPWFRCLQPIAHPRLRLVCFPHAGGGAGLFHHWPGRLATCGIEVLAAQLPGRENRIREQPLDNITEMVNQLAAHLPETNQAPFAFFGHSMGALLAFELARSLRRTGRKEPDLFIIMAAIAPHLPAPTPLIHALPRPEFLTALETRYGGIPPAAAAHTELMDLLLPTLRADMHLCETYAYRPEPPLTAPIIAGGGLDDASVTRPELNTWRQHTTGPFELHLFPGGHFFVQQQEDQLLTMLTERISFYLY